MQLKADSAGHIRGNVEQLENVCFPSPSTFILLWKGDVQLHIIFFFLLYLVLDFTIFNPLVFMTISTEMCHHLDD